MVHLILTSHLESGPPDCNPIYLSINKKIHTIAIRRSNGEFKRKKAKNKPKKKKKRKEKKATLVVQSACLIHFCPKNYSFAFIFIDQSGMNRFPSSGGKTIILMTRAPQNPITSRSKLMKAIRYPHYCSFTSPSSSISHYSTRIHLSHFVMSVRRFVHQSVRGLVDPVLFSNDGYGRL